MPNIKLCSVVDSPVKIMTTDTEGLLTDVANLVL